MAQSACVLCEASGQAAIALRIGASGGLLVLVPFDYSRPHVAQDGPEVDKDHAELSDD